MNCEIVLINMKKDYGRYLYVNEIMRLFNPKIVGGNDCNIINKYGYIQEWKNKIEYTESAKKTKKQILIDFLKSEKDYLLILEDDIYMLDELFDKDKFIIFIEKINKFLETNPILLYLGICNNFICNNKIEDLDFVSFSDSKKPTSFGAHSFIINKQFVNIVLTRINNSTFYGYPFDLSCLGYLQKLYPEKCFVCNPHIFIQNVEGSNIRNSVNQIVALNQLKLTNIYTEPIIGILKVDIIDLCDINNILYFKKMITCIQPIIKVIYDDFILNDNIKFIMKCKSNIKLKYNNIHNLFDLLLNNTYKYIELFNNDHILLFEITDMFIINSTNHKNIKQIFMNI
jgi:hypothetical protein